MASVINTNLNSLNTQRNLSTSQSSLSTAMQRLSSGLRINSAKDDASGLAIATKMDSQIRGMDVAIRNSNDAISFAQTADGGLSKINDSLQRMRELAVQGSNGTTDNASLATEFSQLQSEISRVSNNTMFNGKNTLGASAAVGVDFQVGAGTTANDTVTLSGADITNYVAPTAGATGAATTALATYNTAITANTAANTASTAAAAASAAAASLFASTGLAADGVAAGLAATAAATAVTNAATTATNVGATRTASLAAATAAAGTGSAVAVAAAGTITVGDSQSSKVAINAIDAAITEVNKNRANYGAIQNRFDAIVSNLQVSSENQSAAKSRIMDTDFAAETANLTRAQILQQAGTAMLAQANSSPNGVLALLRG